MKRQAFTLTEILVVVAILAIAALLLFPMFARSRESGHRSPQAACQSNLKQLALGVRQYIQDYDEKYPPTKNAIGGWGILIFPYVKSEQIFQCSTDKSYTLKTTDYFYNAHLANVDERKSNNISLTILMGDGTPEQPFDAHLSQLPATWIDDSSSPAHRHQDGANYSFADGHVKWLKPDKVTLDKPSANRPTFLVR